MQVHIPAPLKPGDKIAVVAPGRKVSPIDIGAALEVMRSWGLQIQCADHLHSQSHGYLAGSDDERLHDLQQAINDPEIKAIICARGGFGSTRILELLNFQPLVQNPKWLVGFSDVTAIHLKLLSLSIASIHSTMPILFSRTGAASSVESLKHALFTGRFSAEANASARNTIGSATGMLLGGNLSLLCDALGTPSAPDTTGAILIIEEVDEYLYKIDRMMMQLKRAGKLDKLRGLVVGHMTDIKDTDLKFGESVEDIILRVTKEYHYPVVFNFPSGHDHPNLAWIQGSMAYLSVAREKVTLSSAHGAEPI